MDSAAPRRCAQVLRIATSGPDDVSGLSAAIDSGSVAAQSVVAIMAKTEGNGCVNDFSRGLATHSLALCLAEKLGTSLTAVKSRVAIIMSGGCEGAISPHILVFAVSQISQHEHESKGGLQQGAEAKRLALGVAFTRNFLPEEQGRVAQIQHTELAVRQAMEAAGIARPEDVHFVQIKCPLLTKERIAEAASRGEDCAVNNTYASMAMSRGASALGVAQALGESPGELTNDHVCKAWQCYSGRASCSAGIELLRNEVLVMGNSSSWGGNLTINHAVMQDCIDSQAVQAALEGAGISFLAGLRQLMDHTRVVAVMAKAEASSTGSVRGLRHTMLDDSDIQSTRHARAVVGGVLAGIIGHTQLNVSGGGEHQGPDGGGPIAVIVRL